MTYLYWFTARRRRNYLHLLSKVGIAILYLILLFITFEFATIKRKQLSIKLFDQHVGLRLI